MQKTHFSMASGGGATSQWVSMSQLPNLLVILADDLGYSDLGCYGGEIDTPHLDRLAADGLRFTQFYNTPRCSPSRASFLTGLYPHQAGIGLLTDHRFDEDYAGRLNDRCVTLPEVLRPLGYRSYCSGKWHVAGDFKQPDGAWPNERGFDHHYGILSCGASFFNPKSLVRNGVNVEAEAAADPEYYMTDAFTDDAVATLDRHFAEHPGRPFFHYLSHAAPHSPMHAKPADIAKYRGRFAEGWDKLREARYARQKAMGLIDSDWPLSPRDPAVPDWDSLTPAMQEWEQRRMEVYAAMVDCLDQGVGRVVAALERHGQLNNTLILFLSDNGASAEGRGPLRRPDGRPTGDHPELLPGGDDSWMHYGVNWANVSTTPFRLYKHWTHEGGISTPCIAHWPAGFSGKGEFRHAPAFLPDIMATAVAMAGAEYPGEVNGRKIPPMVGTDLRPLFRGGSLPQRMLFWEHEGNAAVRDGEWKLVLNFSGAASGASRWRDTRGDWELYHTATDRTELRNVASRHPERVQRMLAAYEAWATEAGVVPREAWLAKAAATGVNLDAT